MRTGLVVLCVAVLMVSPAVAGADWPHLRGPAADGRVEAAGTFEADDTGLDVAWRIPIGSGYSGVAVSGGLAVTAFARDGADWVVAFDAATGKESWRHSMGPLTPGHDGSDDGPLSSPVIGNGRVYALASDGRMFALKLADGALVWKKQLKEEYGAEPADFGFATTPLVIDDLLVVQIGGSDGRAIVGLESGTGDKIWAQGDARVRYQSPAVMTLAGKRQIVAIGTGAIVGLDPDSGEVLWQQALGEEDRTSSTTPTFAGDDRFLVFVGGGATVYRVSRAEGAFAVEELYRTEALGRNYAPPIYHDGHLYGFRGQVLTCADASNGERVWRSRPPGGDGLILVDGHLVIFGAKGNVVVAEATPAGYRERARLQALDGSSLTWPSFARGRVYVRNLEEMAAVSVKRGKTVASVAEVSDVDHEFGRWVREVRAAEQPQAMVDAFFEKHESMPILEREYVHFVYRGEASDVSIQGSMNDSGLLEPMQRVERTDLHYRSLRLEPGGRWEYRFQVDFGDGQPDPLNPHTVPATDDDGVFSEVVTEGYTVASHLAEPSGKRGRVVGFKLTSEILGSDKEIRLWLPPGYDDGDATYPLLIVNDGHAWLEKGRMANSLDNLVGKRVAPLLVAFVEPSGRWWEEAGGSRNDDYARMLAEELIPAVEKEYRVDEAPGSRAVLGNRFYAFSTVYAALKYPEVFGRAAMQSVYMGMGHAGELTAMIDGHAGSSVRFYLDWNRYDERNVDRGWDFAADSRALAESLRKAGYALQGGEVLDSHGWGGWSNRTDRMLIALFPKK